MIDERMEEQASLYVAGALEGAEKTAFETALRQDAELQTLVAALNTANAAMAGTVLRVDPPKALRQKILDGIDQLSQTDQLDRILHLPSQRSVPAKAPVVWLPWAMAACLALLCVVLAGHNHSLNDRIANLNQLATTLQGATNEMGTLVATLQETNHAANARIEQLNQLAASLQSTTNDLQHAIAALQETNRVAGMRIALLGSLLSDQPKAVAVSLWDDQNQTGVFVVENMKPLPSNKDYQLWVIDPQYKAPVDAGVFQVDEKGNVRIQFKAKSHITAANKFAVTEEDKGGSPTPKGTMVLIGG